MNIRHCSAASALLRGDDRQVRAVRTIEVVNKRYDRGKRCSDVTLPVPGSVAEVRGSTSRALRPHWTPTLERL